MKAKASAMQKPKGMNPKAMRKEKSLGASMKKGLADQKEEAAESSDEESMEDKEEASTPGLMKQKVGSGIHAMGQSLLKDQDHIHEAAGFVSKK